MEAVRKELMPYVALTCLSTGKFKTGCLSVSLLTQLTGETAAKNALIPRVLRQGTTKYPDMESISIRLEQLYGARIEPVVRKKGEIQAVGFYADFADDRYVQDGSGILENVASLMGEMLLSPNTRGGLLLPAYVENEKKQLLDLIRGRINDKRSYSIQRLTELMCCYEDYAVDKLGSESEAETINYTKLTRHYRDLLSAAPIEIFYCGSAEPERVAQAVTDALMGLPRGEIDLSLGTDIRMNSVDGDVRRFTEELDVTQGKLAIGFRLGACMAEPEQENIRVFNALYGGSVTSKLFMNVREKLSLAYFASSMIDRHKGLLIASSGIEFDKYDAALGEILAQLELVKSGDFTDEELTAARNSVSTDFRAAMDSQGMLEDFWLAQNIDGLDYGPEELSAMVEAVMREDVISVARGVECDAVYFLRGPAGTDE